MTSLPVCDCENGIATCPRHGIDKSAYAQARGKSQSRKSAAKSGKPLPRESAKQAKRTAFLHGVKAERLWGQLSHDAYFCEECVQTYGSWEEAWNALTLHHTVKRSKGHGYVDYADFGVDEPRLLVLVCNSCHAALESAPQFSTKEAS